MGLDLRGQPPGEAEEHLEELAELVDSCNGRVLSRVIQRRQRPDPRTFIGRGKAREIGETAKAEGAELVIFDDDLSPSQVKNLEKIMDLAVLDRSSLILEIFERRARSREARTQVELARLRYTLPRLTRMWTHLSRQVGGIGVRGGAGESQLEADRRILRQRIKKLEKDLVKIERTRTVQRQRRGRLPVVALAGYTNAGKTTLFQRLSGAPVKGENRLFATLDARLRRGAVAPRKIAVFGDTVGFIRKLPHHLVSSFRSTLEEIAQADLVLHVVDRSHEAWAEQLRLAEEVLQDLGVEPDRILTVFNKIDLLPRHITTPEPGTLEVSATTDQGLEHLRATLVERLFPADDSPVDT